MSETEQGRTEDASAYKLDQAKKKGVIPKSPELATFAALLTSISYLAYAAPRLGREVSSLCLLAFGQISAAGGDTAALTTIVQVLFHASVGLILAPLVIGWCASTAVTLLQTGIIVAPSVLRPDWNRLNPLEGFKRIVSFAALLDGVRILIKLCFFGLGVIAVVLPLVERTITRSLTAQRLAQLLGEYTWVALRNLLVVSALFVVVDIIVSRRRFAGKMKMSRRELKEEAKNREGDPRIRQRRRQLQREMLRRASSVSGVRGADMLVVNPVHFAIALRYDPAVMQSPQVTAKGAGDFALRLKRVAFTYGVPVVEDKGFARALFFGVGLNQEIPDLLYRKAGTLYMRVRNLKRSNDA
jgi:flagellar biosynthesis protein FlhB